MDFSAASESCGSAAAVSALTDLALLLVPVSVEVEFLAA